MITDSQVYTALCIALLAGILAVRLGSTLYEEYFLSRNSEIFLH